MRKYILILILLVPASNLAQSIYPKHQAGLGFSLISGGIISYQIEFDTKYALKTNGLVYYKDFTENEFELYANIGTELQYNIYKQSDFRIYGLIGTSFWYLQYNFTSDTTINDVRYQNKLVRDKKLLNLGIGSGLEYKLHQSVALSFDCGIFLQNNLYSTGNFEKFIDKAQNEQSQIGLSIGIGIRYIFY